MKTVNDTARQSYVEVNMAKIQPQSCSENQNHPFSQGAALSQNIHMKTVGDTARQPYIIYG
jgi:fido (protein-threonine AMPylation protein)